MKNKNKPFGSHQLSLINPKKGQKELTPPDIKNPNFELISKFPRISPST